MSKRPRDLSSFERRTVDKANRAPPNRGPRPRTETTPPASEKPLTAAPVDHPAAAAKPPSKIPLVLFALIALVGLAATTGALMIHVLTGGSQTEFSEEVLAQELVPVEPPVPAVDEGSTGLDAEIAEDPLAADDDIDVGAPTLILTRGDPIIVERRQSVARQLAQIDPEKAKPMMAMKLSGEFFRLTDNLGAAPVSLASAAPGSQLGFAFNAADAETEEGETEADDAAPAAPQIADDEDATLLTVSSADGEGVGGPSRVLIAKPVAAETPISDFFTASGFDADMAKLLETVAGPMLGATKLGTNFAIAAVGIREDDGDAGSGIIPVQVAFYKDSKFVTALALNETGAYVTAANPWFGQDPFRGPDEGVGGTKQRLLDVIYAAAVRNNLPTTVAGEIIMLLSRQHDLEQPANGDETIQVIYVSKPRDKKTGLGKVLYVRVDRGTGDPLECFAFQPQKRKPFECISGAGDGASSGGMTIPVKGVLDRKFGPGKDPVTKKKRMFYGVEWIAPPGTPVGAAYGGTVLFAGSDPKLGNVVKVSHEGGQSTVYGKLKTIATGIVEGKSVRPGQRLGTVGVGEGAVDSRLYFELQRNGQPVDPFGEYQARVEKGGAIEAMVYRITTIESGNNCKAKNPLSSAAGLGQFIISTWLRIIRDYRPDLVAGRSREEILNLRYDCAIALEMTTALTRENANYIKARGHAVTPGNLYLAHFLGPGGAVQALSSSPDASVGTAFGALVVKQNPFLEGWTCSMLINWAARKMAGKGKAPIIAPSQGTAKAQSLASNKEFLQFRDAVLSLIN